MGAISLKSAVARELMLYVSDQVFSTAQLKMGSGTSGMLVTKVKNQLAEPSISGINDMERIIKTANNFKIKTAVCINKYDTNIENTEKIMAYCEKHNLLFVGKIPFDTNNSHQ